MESKCTIMEIRQTDGYFITDLFNIVFIVQQTNTMMPRVCIQKNESKNERKNETQLRRKQQRNKQANKQNHNINV